MRTHRIYLAHLRPGVATLTGSEAHHLGRVLRVKVGEAVAAFDGSGLEAKGYVKAVEDSRVVLELDSPTPATNEAAVAVSLALALLKGDKLSDVVRQTTELGVVAFQPFVSRRCDVKTLSHAKLERLRRVAQAAAKQSGRSVVPTVEEAVALKDLTVGPQVFVAHPGASAPLGSVYEGGDATFVTGPEGGFNDDELEQLTAKGATPIRLGSRILRAETAPVALTAALLVPDAL